MHTFCKMFPWKKTTSEKKLCNWIYDGEARLKLLTLLITTASKLEHRHVQVRFPAEPVASVQCTVQRTPALFFQRPSLLRLSRKNTYCFCAESGLAAAAADPRRGQPPGGRTHGEKHLGGSVAKWCSATTCGYPLRSNLSSQLQQQHLSAPSTSSSLDLERRSRRRRIPSKSGRRDDAHKRRGGGRPRGGG